jgi:lipoprotein-anchoring transpeptidase ErfK/SrfK
MTTSTLHGHRVTPSHRRVAVLLLVAAFSIVALAALVVTGVTPWTGGTGAEPSSAPAGPPPDSGAVEPAIVAPVDEVGAAPAPQPPPVTHVQPSDVPEPGPQPEPEPAPEPEPEPEPEPGPTVTAVQERLRELGYLVGAVDGERGQQTVAAVMAFQRVNGLQVDGVVGPMTTAALAGTPVEPSLGGGPDERIEVDLTRQLLHLVEGGRRVVTLHVSSGNGATYDRLDGSTSRARTPVGEFRVLRRIAGERESSAGLGTLYDPMYFHNGFAIHGSNSVPAWPASHGCIRVSRADARWLFARVPDGMPVHLYGGTHVFTPSR